MTVDFSSMKLHNVACKLFLPNINHNDGANLCKSMQVEYSIHSNATLRYKCKVLSINTDIVSVDVLNYTSITGHHKVEAETVEFAEVSSEPVKGKKKTCDTLSRKHRRVGRARKQRRPSSCSVRPRFTRTGRATVDRCLSLVFFRSITATRPRAETLGDNVHVCAHVPVSTLESTAHTAIRAQGSEASRTRRCR